MSDKDCLSIFQRVLRFKLRYSWLFMFAAVVLLASSCLGFFGRFYWFFDLFSHFRVQYSLAALICSVSLLVFASVAVNRGAKASTLYIWSGVGMAVVLINSYEVLPVHFSDSPVSANGAKLRLTHINVNTSNTHYADVREFISKQDPDILLLEEVNNEWLTNLSEVTCEYPYKKLLPQGDNFGIAIFAKIKPLDMKVKYYGRYALPYIRAVFEIGGKRLVIFGVHTIPPVGKEHFDDRNAMLRDLAKWVDGESTALKIILGDLNITPYSYFFKKLLADADLRDSRIGFGIQPSWPSSPLALLIPLDHCLVSKDIAVRGRFIGSDVGSDHYPVVIDIQLP